MLFYIAADKNFRMRSFPHFIVSSNLIFYHFRVSGESVQSIPYLHLLKKLGVSFLFLYEGFLKVTSLFVSLLLCLSLNCMT